MTLLVEKVKSAGTKAIRRVADGFCKVAVTPGIRACA
jgi:hypothetical protein